MASLVGREEELEHLGSIYAGKGLRTCAVFGDRSVGVTSVLRAFCEGKRSLFLTFDGRSLYENLWGANRQACLFTGIDMPLFESGAVMFDALAAICRKPGVVLVMDGFENLVARCPDCARLLSDFLSRVNDTETMVIVAGSTRGGFKESLDGPLATRFHERIEVRPLTLEQTLEFHPDMTLADAVKVYLTVGGIPKYHRMMDGTSYRKAVEKCFLGPEAAMAGEVELLISRMPTPTEAHSAIASCIADGLNRQSEIVARLGMTKSLCKRYMDDMTDSGLAEVLIPMLDSPRRPAYRLSDGLLAFHYHVLRRHEGRLPDDDVKATYRAMEDDIWDFLTDRFSGLCASYLKESCGAGNVGRWWSKDASNDSEVPIVASVDDGTGRLLNVLGDCRFREKRLGMKTLTKLTARAESIGIADCRYMLFSASGFSSELVACAEANGVTLVGLEDMVDPDQPDRM